MSHPSTELSRSITVSVMRRYGFAAVVLLVCAPVLIAAFALARRSGPDLNGTVEDTRPEASRRQVTTLCADCHAFPPPESFPRIDWPREVERGYDFFYNSDRRDQPVPPMQQVIDYYQRRAPEEHTFPRPNRRGATPVRFESERLGSVTAAGPAVAHVRFDPRARSLLWSDMGTGDVVRLGFSGTGEDGGFAQPERLIGLSNPCHVELVDLDEDGRMVYVVADLGSFLPEDHDRGRVVWVHRSADGNWMETVLARGLGRVADVRVADFDGDGDPDFVVAEFGWLETGSVLLLENEGRAPDGGFVLKRHVVDSRHGAIHVPVADLNGDGRPDFAALISQEHEVVEAYLNRGKLEFERRRIFAADDPAFGFSGIEFVDLNGDGRVDVLATNGDSFDSGLPKPYHGVHWLENRGEYPFKAHRLATMPGVHRALAGDLDEDGDLDVAAVALLSQNARDRYPETVFDSVIWLEQTEPGMFVRHVLEADECNHAVCELADLDGDGDLDLAVGNYATRSTDLVSVTIWRNVGKR